MDITNTPLPRLTLGPSIGSVTVAWRGRRGCGESSCCHDLIVETPTACDWRFLGFARGFPRRPFPASDLSHARQHVASCKLQTTVCRMPINDQDWNTRTWISCRKYRDFFHFLPGHLRNWSPAKPDGSRSDIGPEPKPNEPRTVHSGHGLGRHLGLRLPDPTPASDILLDTLRRKSAHVWAEAYNTPKGETLPQVHGAGYLLSDSLVLV